MLVEADGEDEYRKAEQPKYQYFSEEQKKRIEEEYNKLPNHPYFSKEEEEKIKERIIKMPHHEKIKFIERLYKLMENHENQEEGMDGDDYFFDILGVADAVVKKIELLYALCCFNPLLPLYPF